MNKEQQKALALAKARRRRAETETASYLDGLNGSVVPRIGALGEPTTIQELAENYKPDTRSQEEKMRDMGKGRDMGPVMSGLVGAAQGGTFGLSDEIIARAMSASPSITYDDALAFNRGILDGAREKAPVAAIGGEALGSILMPAAAFSKGKTLFGTAVKSAGLGGLLGGAYGFGAGEGGAVERGKNAIGAGLLSAGIGAAIPAISSAANKLYTGAKARAAAKATALVAPSSDDLRSGANAIYDAADLVPLPRQSFAASTQGAIGAAARKGLDADLTPGAAKVADRMTDAAAASDPAITFGELDILRRKAAVPAGNLANKTESAIGSGFVDAIDDFVDNVDPSLSDAVGKARDMWGRLRRSELVQKAITRASTAASGVENGLRVEFRAILRDPKKMRGFSPSERDAISAVAKGTTFGNIMKKLGVVGISSGGGGSGLGLATGTGFGATVGTMVGGPIGGAIGATIPPVIGSVAKKLSERSTVKAAEMARGLAAAGGVRAPVTGILPGTLSELESMARRGLLPIANQGAGLLPFLNDVNVSR